MKILNLICAFLFVLIANSCYSQNEDIYVSILKKNRINKTYVFDSSNKNGGLYKIHVTYLGAINSSNANIKIITRKIVWGSNQHTSGAVYVYNNKNEYVGKYSLGSGFDLPNKIQKQQLVFSNRYKKNCDSNLTTTVDFSKEIPQKLFLKCKGDYGDTYSFSTERD